MPQNIGDNVINEEGIARIKPADAARLSRYLLQAGDIVYSRRGDVTRRALVQPSQGGWLCGTGCLRVRLGTSANPRFVSYYLRHPNVREWIERHAIGATMPNLNTKILSSLPVTRPSGAEQDAIAGILGALDDKIAHNDRIAGTSQELVSTTLIGMLVDDIDASSVVLGDVSTVNQRKVKPVPGGFLRYIDISSVSVDRFEWPDRTLWEEAPGRARRGVSPGDTIWSTVRPGRRSRALILDNDPELVVSTGFAVLTPREVGAAFLFEVTRRDEFVQYLESVAEGSAYPAVRAERFEKAPIPLLSPDYLAKFESEAIQLQYRIHAAGRESRTLAELRDTLLPKLMTGEIRVRDAEKAVE
jgi:type I restriction enzyme S subunit